MILVLSGTEEGKEIVRRLHDEWNKPPDNRCNGIRRKDVRGNWDWRQFVCKAVWIQMGFPRLIKERSSYCGGCHIHML